MISLERLLFTGLPASFAVMLHGGLLMLFLLRWPDTVEVVATPNVQIIRARIVNSESINVASKQKQILNFIEPKKKSVPLVQSVSSELLPREAQLETGPEPEGDASSIQKLQKLDTEQLALLTMDELNRLISLEQLTADAEASSPRDIVAAAIRGAVINKWTRPPSARNGMLAVLSIQLVPTGEVVGVSILQSSGNDVFDRSAMSAVERVGRFPEVSGLDRHLFENNFRRFQLIFRPEDLRY